MFRELRRNHWIYIIENIFKIIKEFYFIIAILAVSFRDEWWAHIIAIVAIMLTIMLSIVNWNLAKFQIEDNSLIYNKGLIEKKMMKIPFDKITTIDIGISILDRILNTCSAKIDTGAAKTNQSEIKLRIKINEAKEFKAIILKNNNTVNKENLKVDNDVVINKVISLKELLV